MFGSEHKIFLSQTLWDYSKCQHLTDISIRCLDGVVCAHKAVMVNACPNLFSAFPILGEQETITMIFPESSQLEVIEALQKLYMEGSGESLEDILGISSEKLFSSLKEEVADNELDSEIVSSCYQQGKDEDKFCDGGKKEQNVDMGDQNDAIEDKNSTELQVEGLSYHMRKKQEQLNYAAGDYPCDHCNVNLGNRLDLSIHLIPIPCIFCQNKSSCVTKAKEHLKEKHPLPPKNNLGFRLFTCPSCSYSSVRSNVINHFEASHGGKVYICFFSDCEKSYSTRAALVIHVEKTHVDNSERREHYQIVQCEHCSKVLMNKDVYLSHMKLQHASALTVECSWCGKTFKNKSYLTDHEKRMHLETAKVTCDICGLKVTKLDDHKIRKHPENVDPDKLIDYQCQHCEFQTKIRGTLRQHIFRLHTEKTIQCEICPFKTAMKSLLKHHKKNVHGTASLPCQYEGCSRKFVRESVMRDHMKRTHPTGVFHCEECGKQFMNQVKMNRHMKSHNLDTEGFHCTVCPQKFVSKPKLKEHMNVHTGETPFRCPGDGCQKAFTSSSALAHHKKGCLSNLHT